MEVFLSASCAIVHSKEQALMPNEVSLIKT